MIVDTKPSLVVSGPLIRPGRLEDCQSLAPRLRADNVDELWCLLRQGPLEALEDSFNSSDETIVIEVDGQPALMAGVAPFPGKPERGCVWMLGTNETKKASLTLLRESRKYIAHLHLRYQELWNLVDERCASTLRWLHWLGFETGNIYPEAGHDKLPFVEVIHYANKAEKGPH